MALSLIFHLLILSAVFKFFWTSLFFESQKFADESVFSVSTIQNLWNKSPHSSLYRADKCYFSLKLKKSHTVFHITYLQFSIKKLRKNLFFSLRINIIYAKYMVENTKKMVSERWWWWWWWHVRCISQYS